MRSYQKTGMVMDGEAIVCFSAAAEANTQFLELLGLI